jgi:hypothetical protein
VISLTLKQLALAIGATPKWVLNAAPRLARAGHAFAYTDTDAKWLRLARVLNRDLRIPLPHAATLARRAVSPADSVQTSAGSAAIRGSAALAASSGDGVRLAVDLARYESTFEAALASAKAFGAPRRAGRKRRPPAHFGAALGRARRSGIDLFMVRATLRYPLESRLGGRSPWEITQGGGRSQGKGRGVTGAGRDAASPHGASPHGDPPPTGSAPARVAELLRRLRREEVRSVVVGELAEVIHGAPLVRPEPCVEICYDPSPPNVRRIVRVLRGVGARPAVGSAPRSTESVLVAATFVGSPTLVLATRFGDLTLRPHVAGVGEFGGVERAACIMKVFDVDASVLQVAALCRARHAAGTLDDMARVPYLDALAAMPLLEARRREVAALRDTMDQRLKQ